MPTNQQVLPRVDLKVWLSLVFTVIVLLFLLFNTLFEETFGKRQVIVKVTGFNFGFVFTDLGTLKFYEPAKSRRWPDIRFLFWRDTTKVLKPLLRLGCRYELMLINSPFDDHELGENRMPPQTTIVHVLRRIEKTQEECDISLMSGKPVCRDDQVGYKKGQGVFPLSNECNYESFDWKSFEARQSNQ